MKSYKQYIEFEKMYQVVSWGGAFALLLVVFFTESAMSPALFLISALLGISSLLFANLLPVEGVGFMKYKPEDKVLVESLVMIILLTAFLYIKPFSSVGFFVLLIPILIEAMVLHEKIIFAEALFASVAVIFLGIASKGVEFYREPDFFFEAGIFLTVVVLMYVLTKQLRQAGERNEELATGLSERLDQIQVIGMLVEQSENFQRFDLLLERVGEITSDAFNSEQCGFFLMDSDNQLRLHDASIGFAEHDRHTYRVELNMKTPLSVFENGNMLMINNEEDAINAKITGLVGDRHLRNFIMVPLGVKERRIGVIMISNKRGTSFNSNDLHFLQLLAGFIATLIDSASAFTHVEEERKSAQKLTKLLVGRELKMKEMKKQLTERGL